MRILVFCGTLDALSKFVREPGWDIGSSKLPFDDREEVISRFKEKQGALLAVDQSYIHGWRAPADTSVLFDPSWPFGPGSPEWSQAVARRDAGRPFPSTGECIICSRYDDDGNLEPD